MLNQSALNLVTQIRDVAARFKVEFKEISNATLIDCGVQARGGIEAGLMLSRVCLANLASVEMVTYQQGPLLLPGVQVKTDHPVLACIASQYAGWQVSVGRYLAMASGPMRAAAAREELFREIPGAETSTHPVGVLEARKLPNEEVIEHIKSKFPNSIDHLTMLIAPTSSLAGTIQVVARSLETALHKLHTLKFDLNQIIAGYGRAPLPPIAKDELQAIGRTNDSILYGGHVTLWVDCDDDDIMNVGPRVPSSASHDYGELFRDLFARYSDFYKIDPLLFSPATVIFNNLRTGRSQSFGSFNISLLQKSFFE